MIGTKFYKPLEADKLFRTVMRSVEREVTEQVAVPVEREVTRTEQEPVYDDSAMVTGYTQKTVTETVQDIEYQTVTKTVTEEVPEQEQYDNPAPNTMTKYRIAAQWCNANKALMVDCGEYYEVQAMPEPTAEEIAAAELEQAKAERAAAVASITVEVDGMVFDGDEKAQERMARAVTMAESMDEQTEWVLHDNTVAIVTAAQLKQACRAAGKAQTALWTVPYTSTTVNSEQHYTLE